MPLFFLLALANLLFMTTSWRTQKHPPKSPPTEKIQRLEAEIQKLKAKNEALETKSFKFWQHTTTLSKENLNLQRDHTVLKQENEELKRELTCAQTFLTEKEHAAQKRDMISEKAGEILKEYAQKLKDYSSCLSSLANIHNIPEIEYTFKNYRLDERRRNKRPPTYILKEILDESQNHQKTQEDHQEKNAFPKNMSKEEIQQTQKPSGNALDEGA